MDRNLVNMFDEKLVLQERKPKNVVDKVPNEILRVILAKMDVQPLISVRCVCKRWKVVIENICESKTSLVLKSKLTLSDTAYISSKLNGLVDLSVNLAILTVKQPDQDGDQSALCENLCLTLAKLFPRVQNLAISSNWCDFWDDFMKSEHFALLVRQWSSTLVTLYMPPLRFYPKYVYPALYDSISQLTALKRLVLENLEDLLPATVAQLEHCTLCFDDYLPDVLPHLGDGLTSLYLVDIAYHWDLTQLAHLSGRLTHLRILSSRDSNQVLSFIYEHFSSLQMLNISFLYIEHDFNGILGQLSKLTQLTNLSLDNVLITMDHLARPNLPTLKSVQTFSLLRCLAQDDYGNSRVGPDFDFGLFCRTLSTIMPNVVQLTIKHKDPHVRAAIVQNLHHFTNLRKHEII